jgi:hypothetical protein
MNITVHCELAISRRKSVGESLKFITLTFLLVAFGCSEGARSRSFFDSDSSSAGLKDTMSDDTTDGGTSTDSGTSSDTIDSGVQTSPECENEGELYCNFECLLPIVDDNCGGCNVRCSAGTTCQEVDGVYDCFCPKTTVRCNNQCIDPLTSDGFCGASGSCTGTEAGMDCGTGGQCVDGGCQCDATHTECGGACVDTLTDETYCSPTVGECGVSCMTGGVCTDGACVCPTDIPDECTAGCVDFLTDNGNCGGCAETDGDVCDTANGYQCIGGSCECAPGTTLCDGVCTNTSVDPDNCGGCYNGGAGPGIQCGYVDAPANTVRQGCFGDTCVDSPCDPLVMNKMCDGLTLRD